MLLLQNWQKMHEGGMDQGLTAKTVRDTALSRLYTEVDIDIMGTLSLHIGLYGIIHTEVCSTFWRFCY